MPKPRYLMNRKDFRIIFGNEETLRNPDYIEITAEEADAVVSKKKTGMMILKEKLYTDRERELREAGNEIGIAPVPSVAAGTVDLSSMKVKQLVALAVERGIQIPEKYTRLGLIDILNGVEPSDEDDNAPSGAEG